jgi:hypothetical protein
MTKEKTVRVLFIRESNGRVVAALVDIPATHSDNIIVFDDDGLDWADAAYIASSVQVGLHRDYRDLLAKFEAGPLRKFGSVVEVVVPDRRREVWADAAKRRLGSVPLIDSIYQRI